MLILAAASAVALTWKALSFRFFASLGVFAQMSVSAGIVADIFPKSATRGYIVGCLMAVTTLGSSISSVISLQATSR